MIKQEIPINNNQGVVEVVQPSYPEVRLVTDSSVTKVAGESFGRKLRDVLKVLEPDLCRDLPGEAEIVFHNTTRCFDWGGWMPPNKETKTLQASLVYHHGAVSYPGQDFTTRVDLAEHKSRFAGLVKEGLKTFVERVIPLASEEAAKARFFKQYYPEARQYYVAKQLRYAIEAEGISDVSPGVLLASSYAMNPNFVASLIFAKPEDFEHISKILVSRSANPLPQIPKTPSSDGRLFLFDGLPIYLLDSSSMNRQFEPSPYIFRGYSQHEVFCLREPDKIAV
ncbi:MAG: hypothetical protein KDD42_06345 [Bdellovibrionales bacterium]|nr:hypothetical protein [Bdellovibrionales bacterium]